MPETIFDYAFPNLRAREVALAAASANRILIEFLVKAGVDRDEIREAFSAKAGELIVEQFEDNAANLLRIMSGTVRQEQGE